MGSNEDWSWKHVMGKLVIVQCGKLLFKNKKYSFDSLCSLSLLGIMFGRGYILIIKILIIMSSL